MYEQGGSGKTKTEGAILQNMEKKRQATQEKYENVLRV